MFDPNLAVTLWCIYLSGYWYRDDSLDLWDAIWAFVQEILSIHYPDDMSVAADEELTMMLGELRQNSNLVRNSGNSCFTSQH